MVKAKETHDTDGLDASYPQGTFAVQYTEAFKLRREKSVCYFHVYQSALKHFWGDSLLTSVTTEQRMCRMNSYRRNINAIITYQ